MFAFAPSMCLFCDCSLVCELQADVVQFSSICVYGVNIRCIWVFYFSPSFHLSFKAFSLFILFHLKHLKIYLSLSCEMKESSSFCLSVCWEARLWQRRKNQSLLSTWIQPGTVSCSMCLIMWSAWKVRCSLTFVSQLWWFWTFCQCFLQKVL